MEIIRYSEKAQNEFVSGIQSLDCVVNLLSEAKIDESTSVVIVKEIVQSLCSPIRQAHACLTTALKFWEDENAHVSEVIERSVAEESTLKRSISEKKRNVEQLNKKLESLNHQIESKEGELQDAKNSVSRAQGTLRDSEKELSGKKKEQEIVTGVGIGLLVIPIVGWIVGPTMIVVGLTVLEDNVKAARGNVESAESNVNDCENRLQAKRTEQHDLRQELSQEERERRETEERLRSLEAKVQKLQRQQKSFLEVSVKLKNTCHVMTKIWGKSRVLNSETRYAYSLEPLIVPLKEIAEMFTPEEQRKMKQTTLLSKDINFAGMSSKLKAVCEKIPGESLAILDDYV